MPSTLDPVEVVDCIEALSKVAELQSSAISRLEKASAEKSAELERALELLGAASVDEYLSKRAAEKAARGAVPSWGGADPKRTKPKGVRESDRRIYAHFGIAVKSQQN